MVEWTVVDGIPIKRDGMSYMRSSFLSVVETAIIQAHGEISIAHLAWGFWTGFEELEGESLTIGS